MFLEINFTFTVISYIQSNMTAFGFKIPQHCLRKGVGSEPRTSWQSYTYALSRSMRQNCGSGFGGWAADPLPSSWVLLIGPGVAPLPPFRGVGVWQCVAHLNEVNCTAKASLVSGPPRKFNFNLRQRQRSRARDRRSKIQDASGQCTHYQLPLPHRQLIGRRSLSPGTLAPSSEVQLPTPPLCLLEKAHQISNVMLPLGPRSALSP